MTRVKIYQPRCAVSILVMLFAVAGCAPVVAPMPATRATPAPVPLPGFDDYPATEVFTGKPAAVNLASHPDAPTFRRRLTRPPEEDTRYAGHYRIVLFGCGTTCQSVWAIDLIDGTVYSLFTSSVGVVYRPDSRLIVMNDPGYYEEMLETSSIAEVEDVMALYGAPEYWVETAGKFERIAPFALRVDPVTRKLVAR